MFQCVCVFISIHDITSTGPLATMVNAMWPVSDRRCMLVAYRDTCHVILFIQMKQRDNHKYNKWSQKQRYSKTGI